MSKAYRAKPSPSPKRFEARLERMRSRLNWVIIYVPFDAVQCWGLRGQIKVKGEINGFAFRTSLFPTREGRHILPVNKRMRKGARAAEGSVARFQIELDREERTVEIPCELKRILSQGLLREARSFRRWYDELNHSTRNDIAKWITEPKSGDARMRRAEQIAERLLNAMEADRKLPPVLQVVFARHPRAREGWDCMSASRRRGHLFGIFYYRTADAQGRRIDKMLAIESQRVYRHSSASTLGRHCCSNSRWMLNKYADNRERSMRSYLQPANFCKSRSHRTIAEQADFIQSATEIIAQLGPCRLDVSAAFQAADQPA